MYGYIEIPTSEYRYLALSDEEKEKMRKRKRCRRRKKLKSNTDSNRTPRQPNERELYMGRKITIEFNGGQLLNNY